MDKGISFIVPCYNNGQYIKELCDSIVKMNFTLAYEILIVDDCSKDREWIASIEYSNVKFILNKENLGVQATRNIGLYEAKYRYIMMLDADDKLEQAMKENNFVDYAINLLEQNDDMVFVHGLVEMFDAYCGYTISAYPIDANMVARKHHVQTSIVYRTEEGRKAGGYSTTIKKWQDWSFGVALLNYRISNQLGIKIGFWDGISYMYRIHNNVRISQTDISEREMARETIKLYPDFFDYFYHNEPNDEIVEKLIDSKPTRLMDLLYVARYNLENARKIIEVRNYDITNGLIGENVP